MQLITLRNNWSQYFFGMAAPPTPPPPLQILLWRHLSWHLWVGLATWVGVVIPYLCYRYWDGRRVILHESFYADHLAEALNDLAQNYIQLAIMLALAGFIPATIGGFIRRPFLASVCRKAPARHEIIWKSLTLFELSVLLLALLPWPIAYLGYSCESIGRQFLVASAFSLPWLVATGLASRKLAKALL